MLMRLLRHLRAELLAGDAPPPRVHSWKRLPS
jgi:hypothetical protein